MVVCNEESLDCDSSNNLVDRLDKKLLDERVVILNSDIDEWIAGKLTRLFETLIRRHQDTPNAHKLHPFDIRLLISSNGGEIAAGSAIIRAIENAQAAGCSVTGIVRGYAFSMAAIILQACDRRIAGHDDVVMVHGLTGATIGDIRNAKADVDMSNRLMDIHARILSERNTSDDPQYGEFSYWRQILDDNLPIYFFGVEALEAGLTDAFSEAD